jgi:hypothetical protein
VAEHLTLNHSSEGLNRTGTRREKIAKKNIAVELLFLVVQ